MKRISLFAVFGISVALLVVGMPLLIASSSSSSSPTSGYVAYQVTLNRETNSTSFIVNESAVPTSQNGFVNLTFDLTSNLRNLTYSRIENTSSVPEIFPFIPEITNQSFSYSSHGMSLGAQISSEGITQITFNEANYSAQKYLLGISITNSSSGKTVSTTGTIFVFPSGLLYSAQIQGSNPAISVSVQLLKTNLPLTNPSSNISTTEGAAMLGVGVLGAAAIAVPWRIRKKRNGTSSSTRTDEDKPAYWVD